MPVSGRTHDETTRDGTPLFIIRTRNEEFEGYRYNVRFTNGEGRTKHQLKAKLFAETHGYEVILHEDMPHNILGINDHSSEEVYNEDLDDEDGGYSVQDEIKEEEYEVATV